MAVFYTEEEVVTRVTRLSRVALVRYVEADVIRPVLTEAGPRFRPVDVARLELICDLIDQYEFEDDALALILSLTDRLHAARADFRALSDAVAAEEKAIRDRIAAAFLARRRG
jgi:hypothetical protein